MSSHLTDYPTMTAAPWEYATSQSDFLEIKQLADPVVQSVLLPTKKIRQIFFCQDSEHPIFRKKHFDWIRKAISRKEVAYFGGLRQTQRWESLMNLSRPVRDGYAIDWPIPLMKILIPCNSHVRAICGH